MANKKISDLTELSTSATGDVFQVVDISDTTDAVTGTNKKITRANIFGQDLTSADSPSFNELTVSSSKIILLGSNLFTSNNTGITANSQDLLLQGGDNMFFAIDANNASTSRAFNWVNNDDIGGSTTTLMILKESGVLNLPNLPTSSAGLSSGDLWNDGGTLKIV